MFRLWIYELTPLLETGIGSWSSFLAETFRAGAMFVQLALAPGSGWTLSNTLCSWHRCWRLMALNSVVSLQSAWHHCSLLEGLLCSLDVKGAANFQMWRPVSCFCMMNWQKLQSRNKCHSWEDSCTEHLPGCNTAIQCGKRARGDFKAKNLAVRIESRRKTLATDKIL